MQKYTAPALFLHISVEPCQDIFQHILHGICHIVSIVRDTRSSIRHGITLSNQFQHFDIIVLVTESNAFFRTDVKQFQQVSESGSLVSAGGALDMA